MSNLTLLGMILGFLLALLAVLSEYQGKPRLKSNKLDPSIGAYHPLPHGFAQTRRPPQRAPVGDSFRLPAIPLQPQTVATEPNHMVRNWRESIEGLVELAFRNLKNARQHLAAYDLNSAVQLASISVENITRALIHCCGSRPDTGRGQEEPLRLLSTRFAGAERAEYDKAVQTVAWIELNRAVLRYLSESNMGITLLNKAKAEQIIESSERAVAFFRQIIVRHFGSEIPELASETCPKCQSFLTSVSCFDRETVRYECNSCHSKWTGPRNT